ncbi:MAG: HD domain-containing protein [Planctomycetia bacterium]|nr:HD domain-containing protein [Planctomycetia bacterium]
MAIERLRQRIAWEAARLLYRRQESEYFRARLKAAKRVSSEPVRAQDLPTRREIREQIEVFARMCDDERRQQELDGEGAPKGDTAPRQPARAAEIDRFHAYRLLLLPLEKVMQKPQSHPEGDALYHSLQVFDLAREHLPYDEEFLLAALLHDVGKALDPQDHVAAALEALDGHITPRTAWLIEHHSEANALRDGTLGVRSRRRLEESPDYDELMLLSRCDREGRCVGVATPDVDDALTYIRDLEESCGE